MSRAALGTVARIATRCSTSPRCTSKGLGILYGDQSNNFLVSWLECAGMLQGVPELGTNLGPTQIGTNSVTGNLLKRVVGRDGIEPPTPGFSVLCSTN